MPGVAGIGYELALLDNSSIAAVPEPSAFTLVAVAGGLTLSFLNRRRDRRVFRKISPRLKEFDYGSTNNCRLASAFESCCAERPLRSDLERHEQWQLEDRRQLVWRHAAGHRSQHPTVFGSATTAAMTDNIAGTFNLNGMDFNAAAPAYALSGNGLGI